MNKISNKISKKFKKVEKSKKGSVINISEFKSIKEKLSDMDSGLGNIMNNQEYDPNHRMYIIVQNMLSYFEEDFSNLIEFSDYYDKVVEIEDEFMPSGPPMSPLTNSYYAFWSLCDLMFGDENETICSIFYDLAVEHKFDDLILTTLNNLNSSYMNFYLHVGFNDNYLLLKDIITGTVYTCFSPAGYMGKKNEIWFVRLVPGLSPLEEYFIILNTPYIVINYTEQDWIDFFIRRGIKYNKKTDGEELYSFMKNNIDFKYWHNYIMDAYVNNTENCIFLTGIPDIIGSKPHEL